MQLASSTRAQDGFMAAMSLWGKKPHQGFSSRNPGLHQQFAACNSTAALGVSWRQWSGTASGARDSYEYDAYGNEFTVSGSTPNEMMYRGEQYDSDLGLYYLRARYYNPLTGRFMSRDPKEYKPLDTKRKPIDPKVLHKYLYADGDPVNIIDPTGKGLIEMLVEEGEEDTAGLRAMEATEKSLAKVFECVAREIANGTSPDAALTVCLFSYGF